MLSLRCRVGLAVLALIAAPLAVARVSLPLPWKQGVELHYQSTGVELRQQAGSSRRVETRENLHLRITEANATGFIQQWTSSDSKISVSGTAPDIAARRSLAQALAGRLKDLPIEAELAPDGNFTGIRNWQPLGTAMREVMLPALLEQGRKLGKPGAVDEAGLRAKIEPLLEKLTAKAALSDSLGRTPRLYNFFTASTLEPGKPVSYQDYLPSPWSADLIPTRGSFSLGEVTADTVVIRWRQDIDPVKGAQVMWKIVEGLTGSKPAPALEKSLPKEFSLSDEATVLIDRRTGIPLRLDYRRKLAAGVTSSEVSLLLEKRP
jgi:hypothetical protein